jgi:hypothetical protein
MRLSKPRSGSPTSDPSKSRISQDAWNTLACTKCPVYMRRRHTKLRLIHQGQKRLVHQGHTRLPVGLTRPSTLMLPCQYPPEALPDTRSCSRFIAACPTHELHAASAVATISPISSRLYPDLLRCTPDCVDSADSSSFSKLCILPRTAVSQARLTIFAADALCFVVSTSERIRRYLNAVWSPSDRESVL